MRVRTFSVAVLVAGALLACGSEPEAPPVEGKPVIVLPVEVRDLEVRIAGTGELKAKYRADVAAQVMGEITAIQLDEGQAAAEGEVVIEIDPERRQLELDRARARVTEARAAVAEQRRALARMKKLHAQNVASDAQLDQADTALRTGRSRLAAAQADLGVAERARADASVRAAFPGMIARRHVSRGEFVNMGQKLFELVSLDPIEVEFHLPEADASRVRVGQPVEVTVAPFPDEVFDAEVTVVSPTIDSRTRTLRVKGIIRNPDGRLAPGLFAKVDVGVAKRSNVILVPEEALLRRADGSIMFRVNGESRVERVAVVTGEYRDGFIEIRSGLGDRDLIVARGHGDLVDGGLVVARNPDGTPAVAAGPRADAEEPGEVMSP